MCKLLVTISFQLLFQRKAAPWVPPHMGTVLPMETNKDAMQDEAIATLSSLVDQRNFDAIVLYCEDSLLEVRYSPHDSQSNILTNLCSRHRNGPVVAMCITPYMYSLS